MNKKRQIVAIVSIVLLTLLIGTLFNMGFIVSGGKEGKKYEELWEAISELQSEVDSLNASLIELEARVSEQGFINAPAYDSGWVGISPAQTIELAHNLNTTEVLVYLIGRNQTHEWKIHQRLYGGAGNSGAFWFGLNNTSVRVFRLINDQHHWDEVRVMIWKISEPPT